MESIEAISRLSLRHPDIGNVRTSNQSPFENEPRVIHPLGNCSGIPTDLRKKWIDEITILITTKPNPDHKNIIRDWDLVLDFNGSVENVATNQQMAENTERFYPERYNIPTLILDKLEKTEQKVVRAELFALGSLIYHLISGTELFSELEGQDGEEEIVKSRIVEGKFPDGIWGMDMTVRVLGSWCPAFAAEILKLQKEKDSSLSKLQTYRKNHPILSGIAGVGLAGTAVVAAVPLALGAAGFSATGVVAGSIAAGWQSSIGLVQAGSLFAFFQGASMGGAAAGTIFSVGIAGAGLAVAATVAGALDEFLKEIPVSDIKVMFLDAWKREVDYVKVASHAQHML